MDSLVLLGEAASLGAALLWAVTLTMFRPAVDEHGAWTVNLGKSSIAAALLALTVLAMGEATALAAAPGRGVAVTALSGVVGLTLGDTALFGAIRRLGVYRALLFQTLGPVFAALIEIGFYGVAPRPARLAGIAVVLAGVALVFSPARPRTAAPPRDVLGYVLAVVAAFGQGAGVVLAKDGMGDLPLVSASFLRLLAGMLSMILVMSVNGRLRGAVRYLAAWRTLRRVVPPTFLGTYVAILMMMAGVAWAPASVAAVLLSTSPIFSLFIDHWTAGTPLTLRALAGTAVAVAGVGVLAAAG
ncbi:MAG TPA: DMT family transporter [Thermoanaerobaculia bacterium]|jgi:drug/metabolite transporter (DMT)-like permease